MLLLSLALATQAVHRINNVQTVTGTTTGASVEALPSDSTRSYLMCQSATTNTNPVLVDFGRAAGAGSIQLTPGGSVTFTQAVPTTNVTVGGTTGSAWVCKSGSN